jgi:phosphoenolpyruvate carboxykinase (GTP)
VPLVLEAFNWNHGVFFGASVSSETTAAAQGEVGKLRHDPFAMLPFCGYHMGDYFAHWISMGKGRNAQVLPRFFQVNWFRKSAEGKYLWPGFTENIHVLKWIFERLEETAPGVETPIGILPEKGTFMPHELIAFDPSGYQSEMEELATYFELFAPKFPPELAAELKTIRKGLQL